MEMCLCVNIALFFFLDKKKEMYNYMKTYVKSSKRFYL